ncbi:hypothetical protein ACERII_22770 [Evansella sp. AB-rgal1]|uniref:hypothetical protein n=1 Tax=Evansella sp. AB-rgal1 TaxID=3242696 RepID=UPI00359E2766
MDVLEKLIAAIVSSLLFSVGLSILNNTMVYFRVYLMFSFFIFLIGGVIFSMLAEHLLEKFEFKTQISKYFLSLIFYSAGGILVNVFLYILIFNEGFGLESLYMMLLGIVAALLFLHVMFITRKALNILVKRISY